MLIGLPKEIKDGERRVALTPEAVRALVRHGHRIHVQAGAGEQSGFPDSAYIAAGARIFSSAAAAFDAELVVKVKEIQPGEWQWLRSGSMLFAFLHLNADPRMAEELLARRITGIAFETVHDANGGLPILAPMSIIAGELAIVMAAHLLLAHHGGKGIAMSDAQILVVGGGQAGQAAARAAAGLGAQVQIVVRRDATRTALDAQGLPHTAVVVGDAMIVARLAQNADVVIGAVNQPGCPTPKLLTRADVAAMQAGSLLLEIDIDGGGIAETARLTTHTAPTYTEEGVIHYCVPNLPALAPRSASWKISAAVLPYVSALANRGLLHALRENAGLAQGLQLHGGHLTHPAVAAELMDDLQLKFTYLPILM